MRFKYGGPMIRQKKEQEENFDKSVKQLAALGRLKVGFIEVSKALEELEGNMLIDEMSVEVYKNQVDVMLRHVDKVTSEYYG